MPMKIEGEEKRATVYVGSADTWKGRNLAVAIVELAEDDKSLLAAGRRLVVILLLGKVPADVVEGPGLPCRGSRGLVMPRLFRE